jgi:hypothetical protein
LPPPRSDNFMDKFECGSYCGLYCGACDVMHQYRKGLENGKAAQWEDLPPTLQRHLPVPASTPVVCHGCKSDIVFGGCAKCVIRNCARIKGVENCAACRRFPCLRFRLQRWVWKFGGFYRRLPHLLTADPNLKEIQAHGQARWLESQQARWTCSHCGSRLTWHTKVTHNCRATAE